MKTLWRAAILAAAIFLLIGCQTKPPTPPWIPQPGERVATNYCEECPQHIGRPYVTTLTKVLRKDGKVTVFANEFPNGIAASWVTKWE